jgi:murein DD-endopeptidase MepM/ murein hydrolase activator NlpD
VQAREVSPLTSCDEQFTPTQLAVLPSMCSQRTTRAQNRRTRVAAEPVLRWTDAVRWLALILSGALISAVPAFADESRLEWPLRPPPTVVRGFDAPSPNWNPGHRGVDLPGSPGQRVYASGSATVVFAGLLAGRPVISLAHPGGLRTSYEPVRAAVRVGQSVTAETVIGELVAGHVGCRAAACLHWGAMWGAASRAEYVDPLGLLKSTAVRLKPLGG